MLGGVGHNSSKTVLNTLKFGKGRPRAERPLNRELQ